jgi:hypothetical protein
VATVTPPQEVVTISEAHSTPRDQPAKPYPDFSLFPHQSGVWARKLGGKRHYFSPSDDRTLSGRVSAPLSGSVGRFSLLACVAHR